MCGGGGRGTILVAGLVTFKGKSSMTDNLAKMSKFGRPYSEDMDPNMQWAEVG